MWTCPHCGLVLASGPGGASLTCANGHAFDRAREGYVNLLPANRKHSTDPGDNALMVAARRRVHEAGIYRPLADALAVQLAAHGPPGAVLDLGCGEGYYCGVLAGCLPGAGFWGVDISRAAVRLAARRYPGASFAVASTFHLPLPDQSFDRVLRVFAPTDDTEIVRVLKPSGVYLEVSPAPAHLWQLRTRLYDEPRAHAVARTDIAGMHCCGQSEVEYALPLSPALLADLVAMTPFAHRGQRERREALLQSGPNEATMAFSLRLFRRG